MAVSHNLKPPAGDPPGSERLAELIERLGRLLRAESHASGLKPVQWEALRYLHRCNRFSNMPGALARYLSATKGTISQTLNALERKGLVGRDEDPASRRIVRLHLTDKGRALLASDPLERFADAAAELAPEARHVASEALAELLGALQRRNARRPFGLCRTCRHFRQNARGEGAHLCALLGEPLTDEDSAALCIEHAEAA